LEHLCEIERNNSMYGFTSASTKFGEVNAW